MHRYSGTTSKFGFERLEDRSMLSAGTVSVTGWDNTIGGDLTLSGTGNDYLTVVQKGHDAFTVIGAGTKINVNGTNYNSYTFKMVGALTLDLSASSKDVVTMAGLNVDGDLTLDLGTSTSIVSLAKVSATDLTIDGSSASGQQVVALSSVSTTGDFSVSLGTAKYNTVAVVNCSSGGGVSFSDAGPHGIISGVLNDFDMPLVTGFQYAFGDLSA